MKTMEDIVLLQIIQKELLLTLQQSIQMRTKLVEHLKTSDLQYFHIWLVLILLQNLMSLILLKQTIKISILTHLI